MPVEKKSLPPYSCRTPPRSRFLRALFFAHRHNHLSCSNPHPTRIQIMQPCKMSSMKKIDILSFALSILLILTITAAVPTIASARNGEDKKRGPGWHVAPERNDWPEHLKAIKDRTDSREDAGQRHPGKNYQFEGENFSRTGGMFGSAQEILKNDKAYTPRLKINPRKKATAPGKRAQRRDVKDGGFSAPSRPETL